MDYYADQILEHYRHPQNSGKIARPTASVSLSNMLCGDKIKVTIKVEKGVLKDFKFMSNGCAISIASASLLSQAIIGKKINKIMEMDAAAILKLLVIPVGFNRIKCMMLPLEAVKKAINRFNS
jgi:nitrogen fixation NifU-like protein